MKKPAVIALLLSVLTVAPFDRTTATIVPQSSVPVVSDTQQGSGRFQYSDTNHVLIDSSDPSNPRILEVRVFTSMVADSRGAEIGRYITSHLAINRHLAINPLDSSFGTGGQVLIPLGSLSSGVVGSGVTSTGKLLVGVKVPGGADPGIKFIRLNHDGTLDQTYGDGGFVTIPWSSWGDGVPSSMHVYPDGRILLAGGVTTSYSPPVSIGRVIRVTSSGQPDPTFDSDGVVNFDTSPADEENLASVTVDTSNRIVLVGHIESNLTGETDSLVLRLLDDGSPDPSFGGTSSGYKIIDNSPFGNDLLTDVTIIPSIGRIVATGRDDVTKESLLVGLLASNGSLLGGFGSGGVRRDQPAGLGEWSEGIHVVSQQDGIIVVGKSGDRSYFQRFTTSGVPDVNYATSGTRLWNVNSDITIASDTTGQMVVLGQLSSPYEMPSYSRLSTSGEIVGGMGTTRGSYLQFSAIAPLGDGRLLVLGAETSINSRSFRVGLVRSDGTLDTSGSGGWRNIPFDAGDIPTISVATIQPDGKVLFAGTNLTATGIRMVVVRFNTDGDFDRSFSDDGMAVIDVPSSGILDSVASVGVQADGRIVVLAEGSDASGSALFVARFNSDGTPDNSFSSDAVVTTSLPGNPAVYATAVRPLPDGKILVAGTSFDTSIDSVVTLRFTATGQLDTSYDVDGIASVPLPGFDEFLLTGAGVQSDGRVVVSGTYFQSGGQGGFVARISTTGALDTTFGSNGTRSINFGSGVLLNSSSLQVDSLDRLYFVGDLGGSGLGIADSYGPSFDEDTDIVVARLTSAGVFDSSFDTDGRMSVDLGTDLIEIPSSSVLNTDGRLWITGVQHDPATAATNGLVVRVGGPAFVPVTPTRIMDTRDGTGGITAGKIGNGTNDQGTVLEFDVRGKGGLPTDATQIGAVSLNVTAANTTAPNEGGWVAVYPCGTNPNVSNLNFINGQITPNAVITPISTTGKICFKVYGRADLIVDVNGWFPAGSGLATVTPSRIMDTRDGTGGITAGKIGNGTNDQGTVLEFDVRGKGGLPTDATQIGAVSLNVTAANTTAPNEGGWVAVYPCGTNPNVSNLNFINGQITPNAVITPISTTGKICFKVYGRADLIVDVNGWFPAGSGLATVTPSRIMDTRDGTGGITAGKIGNGTNDQGTVLEFDVRGKGGLPTDATQIGAVSLNVTAANTTAPNEGGWVAVYPCGTNPNVSNLNFINGQITPNAVITPISTTGKICFKVYGRADLIVDINGYIGT